MRRIDPPVSSDWLSLIDATSKAAWPGNATGVRTTTATVRTECLKARGHSQVPFPEAGLKTRGHLRARSHRLLKPTTPEA